MNTSAPRKLRTLLVDDEALSRRGLELRLRVANDIAIIGECANGREALAAIREFKPDLVFLDIQMPGPVRFRCAGRIAASRAADDRVRDRV